MPVRLDPGFREELEATDEYQGGLARLAETVADAARRVAPERTGHYGRSIKVRRSDGKVYVATTDIAGHLIEFGSAKNPVYAPLRRGARAAGLRVSDTR